MSKHAGTIVGAVLLVIVVLVVIATQGGHDGHHDVVLSIAAASPAPTPTVALTPTPAPDPFAPARWAAANVAVIALMLAIGVGVPVGIALHAWHRGRLAELDHPPLRQPEFVHRAFDVKALEARRGWLPESFTYSPHMRNDVAEVEGATGVGCRKSIRTQRRPYDQPPSMLLFVFTSACGSSSPSHPSATAPLIRPSCWCCATRSASSNAM